MNQRVVVNVATGPHFPKGQVRLIEALKTHGVGGVPRMWGDPLPDVWPTHQQKPYAFKSYAMKECERQGFETLLWCDAAVLPIRSLAPVFEKIERDGYLLMNNGFSNYEWTADSAYRDLFAMTYDAAWHTAQTFDPLERAREHNREIPHTMGGFFGVSLTHEKGRELFAEYYRLASATNAFCGPWANDNYCIEPPDISRWTPGERISPCGPSDVRGHRHDQTALSVIAWRLGLKLTDCPEFLIYGKPEDATDERTLVVVNGAY